MFRRPRPIPVQAVPGAHYRQGDVLLRAIDPAQLPAATAAIPRQGGRIVLAEGEATGHAHAVLSRDARLVGERRATTQPPATAPGTQPAAPAPGTQPLTPRRFLVLDAPADVVHEEHAPIALPAGVYEVVIQREYVPSEVSAPAWRRVVD